ncbi:MAG TPA: DUF5681 domain-containing protein [Stellaceae bacterium]|jgi:hypothetical protein|nr:DUF5681 domain-containing protein [Stellaceae bacterium]
MAVNQLQKQRGRGPGRPFRKGQSGNPAGRPIGSRNRATQLAEAILDDNAGALTEKLVELALEGDRMMLRLGFQGIVPRRARTRPIPLPEIKSAADLAPAMDAIMRAAAEGAVTPFDAAELARMVETALRAFETGDFDRRLLALEREMQDAKEADNHAPPA